MIYDVNGNPLYTETEEKGKFAWHNGSVSVSNGSFSREQADYYKSIFSSLLYVKSGCVVSCADGFSCVVAMFSDRKASSFISGYSGTNISIGRDAYVVISIKKNSNQKITPDDGANVTIDGDYEVVSYGADGSDLGQRFRVARLRELSEVEVMPTASYPLMNGDVPIPSTPFIGIPYSAATRTEGYVGTDVSLYTYLSAVSNPNSVIYTEKFGDAYAHCYYGLDCAGLFWAGMHVHDTLTTLVMQTTDELEEINDLAMLDVGDALLKTGHCETVCYVEKDKYGRIVFIGVNDAWTPYMRRTWYWWDELVSHVQSGNHRLLRYKKLHDSTGSPFDYPFPDDPDVNFTFPKLMPKLGDKVSVLAGKTVTINVLDSTGFSAIEVYKDGSQISSMASTTDFDIENVQPGSYEVRMTGNNVSESCFFHVGDVTMSLDGNDAVFSCAGGFTPYMISAYKKDPLNTQGWATDFTGKKVVKLLSASEISAGRADITDLIQYAEANQGYLKIKAYDDCGTIFRRIELT